jgi:Holliday junction resolvasome RuvABC endonuclease subunit
MHKNPSTILAIDPGLRELGFAVLSGKRLVASGVRPLFLTPFPSRIPEARRVVKGLLAAYRPSIVVVERTYRHPTNSLHSVHRLASALLRLCQRRHVATVTYSPQTVRKVVTGNGNDEKRAAAKVLAAKFPELRIHLSNDRVWKTNFYFNLFDSVALGIFHQHAQPPSRSRPSG